MRRALVVAAVFVMAPNVARAEGGRLDGDLGLSLEGGASFGAVTAGTASFRALYLATAGAYGEVAAGHDGYRLGGAGVEVRPLFIPRFLRNLEGSRDVYELTVDSLSLDVGASFHRGAEAPSLSLGAGVELPFLGRYDGPFVAIHALRELAPAALRGGSGGETRVLITLGIRLAFIAHVVDAGDRSTR